MTTPTRATEGAEIDLDKERAAFEADTLDLYPVATFRKFGSGRYNVEWIEQQWGGWQRRARAALANQAQQAESGVREKLPPLPEPDHSLDCGMQPFYRPDQMQQYARKALTTHQAGAAAAPSDARKWTDLSHRLRETADQQPGWKPLLTAAADEIERYYGGMLNWKADAQAKDRTIIDLRAQLASVQKDAAWSRKPPTEQADYWHWNGDPEHAPMIYHVLWSGTAKKCFVSMGQYDIDEAIWCDNFGGWWLKIEQPSIPSDRAAIAASQKGEKK